MRVAVLGGTGTAGALVVEALAAAGHEPVVLSRRPARSGEEGPERRQVDVATGFGLEDALEGADAVVDTVNDQKQARAVLSEGAVKLAAAAGAQRVGHLLTLSIVGCDRVPVAYYRAKVAQEEAVERGGVPWTILRATQFPELLDGVFRRAARSRIGPRGPARFQPVDPAAVAERIVALLEAGPAGRAPEIAGPRIETLSELSGQWREARNRHFLIPLPVPALGAAGRALAAGALTAPEAPAAGPGFAEWLAGHP